MEKPNVLTIADDFVWSFVEPAMSIIAACLPTLAPLFRGGGDPAPTKRRVQSILSLRRFSSSKKSMKGSNASKSSTQREARHAWLQQNSDNSRSNNITYERGTQLEDIKSSDGVAVHRSLDTQIESV